MEQQQRQQLTRFRRAGRGRRGAALLLVLASLVISASLILAFLAGGASEVKNSAVYAEGSHVSLLADTAVNLVEAEIFDATQGRAGGAGADVAWASQPGMIRTYDTQGNLVKFYKLYSAPDMVGNGPPMTSVSADLVTNWYQDTAYYTDLNEPATIGGVRHYPILDGDLVAGAGGNYVFPSGGSNLAPEGFAVTNPPVKPASGSDTPSQAPFPVQWLYVLQDGTVAPPEAGSGTAATVAGATTANPIVGRIAFWADDETGKVNLNTAGEGVFTDTPRVASTYDVSLATKPPVQNEFQRYPGHPATTSLSAVFGSLLPVPTQLGTNITSGNQTLYTPYYNLTPNLVSGGSQSGTVTATAALTPRTDRLYASSDELLFQPNRTVQPSFNPTAVEQARFFVTANSRSPDVNLFNQPRVCIWPENVASSKRTTLDQLIAFCSTINKIPYYFQRSDWTSQNELNLGNNQNLKSYLRALCAKSIPGFGGSFGAKYNTPTGKGGGTELDQILVEIFDYIRCTNIYDSSTGATPFTPKAANANNTTTPGGMVLPTYDTLTDTKGFGRFPTISKVGILFVRHKAAGAVGTTVATATTPDSSHIRLQAALVFELFDPSEGYPGIYPSNITLSVRNPTMSWLINDTSRVMFRAGTLGTNGGNTQVMRHWGGTLGFRLFRPYTGTTTAPHAFITQSDTAPNFADFPDPAVTNNPQTFTFNGGECDVDVMYSGTVVQTIHLVFPAGNFAFPAMVSPTAIGTMDARDLTSRFQAWGGSDYRKDPYSISQYDILQSIQSVSGDYRLIAGRHQIDATETARQYGKHAYYGMTAAPSGTTVPAGMAHSFVEPDGSNYYGGSVGSLAAVPYGYWISGNYVFGTAVPPWPPKGNQWSASAMTGSSTTTTPDGICATNNGVVSGSTNSWSTGNPPGDWDNGTANAMDGAYINKADEGTTGNPAYYDNSADYTAIKSVYFSPSRQIPSAVMFGSLPTGVIASAKSAVSQPWQTLLFHPDSTHRHKGNGTPTSGLPFTTPPDYLLLDLFTMPVVEPYAISEPLSTAGRINMNYQIVPFTYINRDTGVRAVLKSERILAIANRYANAHAVSAAACYKQLNPQGASGYNNYQTRDFRYDLNVAETIKGFQARFAKDDIFRSPAEICSLDLVPNDTSDSNARYSADGSSMRQYWESHLLTGDNSKERPYADIYPRLTTKSNSFTIHYRVQTLKKLGGAPNQWREGIDLVTAEARGSRLIERYIDPNNTQIPNYSTAGGSPSSPLGQYYRFRVVSSKQFPP